MVKQISVVGAVMVRRDLILCARRGTDGALPGKWEFPGGKIEAGETPQAALIREIREEFLAEIRVGEHIETTTHSYSFGDVTLTTYYCELTSNEVTPTEHDDVRWLRAEDLETLDWAPADIPAVRAIMKRFEEK